MSKEYERRSGQGNDAHNGREPVRSILARNFLRICLGVTGVIGMVITLGFSEGNNAIAWAAGYSGILLGFVLGYIGGELR